ncbi:hypothetical protein F2Q68_00010396 [Brassica cretica]|uniref:CCHC-type domain-containing protein n=1 Tax=Brassica cretica TaxID=69181 RepID=A0A8S9L4J5_BRACR|nr:hypothetical protein F2Q68_00010396 [Brassica cretica]
MGVFTCLIPLASFTKCCLLYSLSPAFLAVRKPYPDCSFLIQTAPWSWFTLQGEARYRLGPWYRQGTVKAPALGRCVVIGSLLISGTTRNKSRKEKEAAGASGNVEVDGTAPSQVFPSQLKPVNYETGFPQGPTLPIEVNVTAVDDQQELGREEEAESSHAREQARHGTSVTELVEPSMKDVLDAVKTMGTQMLALTQAFTPLVNSSVGQVTPAQTAVQAARTTAQAAQTTARRKRDSAEEGKSSNGKSECSKCCRCHGGECWKAMGACTRCGKMDHATRNCLIWEQSRG